MTDAPTPFRSFFLGGFECSTHRTRAGRRLDLIAATGHDRHARADYTRLAQHGLRAARDGVRWHLVEHAPERYDFSTVLPLVRAARAVGVQVIWDLCHYGWPDGLDVFSPAFVHRFARLARAFVRLLTDEGEAVPVVAPVNEISFFAWAGGDVAYMNPLAEGRGRELKAQLVRAAVAAIEAIRDVNPSACLVHPEPVIHVHAHPGRAADRGAAGRYTLARYEAWDMLAGRLRPELGGRAGYLDILGVTFYPHNQWIFGEAPYNPETAIRRDHPLYRPFRRLLREVHERYGRPLFVAETGADGEARPAWLRYIGQEVRAAQRTGVPVGGVCLYPIVDFPWWDDGRHLDNGLWSFADEAGDRELHRPLARELRCQQRLFRCAEGHGPVDALSGVKRPNSLRRPSPL